jgi:prevent-host-death family protein
MTTAQARRDWARVLRSARRGAPVEITSNGLPVAAVVSIDQLRSIEKAERSNLADAILTARAMIDVRDLAGPDPWSRVRSRSRGRDVDLGDS